MKLLYVSNALIPSHEANSIQIMRMCEAFSAIGHEVTLLCSGTGRTVDAFSHYGCKPCFEIHYLCETKAECYTLSRLRRLFAFLLSHGQYDLVYGRYVPGLLLCGLMGIPVVFEAHALPVSRRRKWAERALFALPAFRRLVTISESLAGDYKVAFPYVAAIKRVMVAHDGARVDSPSQKAQAEQKSGRLKIGYLGSFYRGKGAEIAAKIASHVPGHDFHLYGGTLEELMPLMPEGWQATGNLWIHGRLAPVDVGAATAAMDILLLPAQPVTTVMGMGNIARWMSPLKLFEYMASGRAVVCSDLEVFREILVADRDAILVKATEVGEWVDAVVRLAGDPDLRRRLGVSAAEKCRDRYSWSSRARRVLAGR